MADEKKPKQRHRLIPSSQNMGFKADELGLTGRIKKALLQKNLGITQRIKKAIQKTQDEKSIFYLKTNHIVMLSILIVLLVIFGYLAFRTRYVTLNVSYKGVKDVSSNVPLKLPFYRGKQNLEVPPYPREVEYKRIDIYGERLEEKEYWVTQKGEKVPNKRLLMPGDYKLHIKKDGYEQKDFPLTIGDNKVVIPVELKPLVEKKRELVLKIHDPLIQGEELEADDILISGESYKDKQIKPGHYTVQVQKKGYYDKMAEIFIPESGIVEEQITLDYKKRKFRFFIDDGLRPEDQLLELPHSDMTLIKEEKKISLESGAVYPGGYDLIVERDGYKRFKKRVTIYADDNTYDEKLPLEPLQRKLRLTTNYDIVPPELKPDEAYLKDLASESKDVIPITEGLKVNPGKYWLVVKKAGYNPFSKEIFIDASSQDFEIKAHLISVTKSLLLKITSDFDVWTSINPDFLGVDIDITKKGFKPIKQLRKVLPPEKKEIPVPVFLETIPRQVIAEITSNIKTGPITADLINLTRIKDGQPAGKSKEITAKEVFKPGKYILDIKKTGYVDIHEEIIIYPDNGPYYLKKKLVAYKRKFICEIDSDYEPEKYINPDEILVNRERIQAEVPIDPGVYDIICRKAGYKEIEKKTVEVIPKNEPFVFKARFLAKPRLLKFDIKGGEGFGKIEPDSVSFDKNEMRDGDSIPPQKLYTVNIKKKGYAVEILKVSVPPSEDPFILSANLSTLKRKILLKLTANYPPGANLMPPDSCSLTSKKTSTEENFTKTTEIKPGDYKLLITKRGYKPVDKDIKIAPDEAPFYISEVMYARERKVKTNIDRDIEPDEGFEWKPFIKIVSKDGRINKELKDGDNIEPNEYKITIEVPGYKAIEKDLKVPPDDTDFPIKEIMKALPRPVLIQITSDYMPHKKITADKLTCDGDTIQSVCKLQPGTRSITIAKAGYYTYKEDIAIPAGTTEFKIVKQIKAQPRVVTYEIISSEDGKKIIPDVITLGGKSVTGASAFKPGDYKLEIKAQGFDPIREDLSIPPGQEAFHIKRSMIPSFRIVKYKITGDYNPVKELTPKLITLNGESVDGEKKFAPGAYNLVIYKEGYTRVTGSEKITASKEDYLIQKMLISKPRKVNFNIVADFPKGVKLKPDKVTFNNKVIIDGEEVKPLGGGYQVYVEKLGYMANSSHVQIEPSEKVFVFNLELKAKPRILLFELDSDYKKGVPIKADAIYVDGKKYGDNDLVKPGEHKIKIEKAGFETLEFKEIVDAGIKPYKIKKTLITKPRIVKLKVTTDLTGNQLIEPEVSKLGDVDLVDEEQFKPGNYTLNIGQSGYFNITKPIEVVPGEGKQILEEKLIAKPRKVVEELKYDVPPTKDLKPHKIRLRNLATGEVFRFTDGDKLKPGEYHVTATKEGYEPYSARLILRPDDRTHKMEVLMIAKPVQILIKIDYDIAPPAGLPPYTVTFVDLKTGVGRHITHGKKIKPGNYKLEVARPGYKYTNPGKKIYVPPGEKPYNIHEKLIAKERPLSFEMSFGGEIVKAYEVLIDNEVVKPQDTFKPGKSYNLIAKFEKYKTVKKAIVIPPGEGPYVVDVNLIDLKQYEFKINRKYVDMVIEGIRYPIEIYADAEKVEKHHIKIGGGVGLIYGNFFAPKQMSSAKIRVAFYYDDALVQKSFEFRDLRRIDSERLLEHLRELAKGRTPEQALRSVRALLRDRQDKIKLKELPLKDRSQIANVLRDLELPARYKLTRQKIIKELESK